MWLARLGIGAFDCLFEDKHFIGGDQRNDFDSCQLIKVLFEYLQGARIGIAQLAVFVDEEDQIIGILIELLETILGVQQCAFARDRLGEIQ